MKRTLTLIILGTASLFFSGSLVAESGGKSSSGGSGLGKFDSYGLAVDASAISEAGARVRNKGNVNTTFNGGKASALIVLGHKSDHAGFGIGAGTMLLTNSKSTPADDPKAKETIKANMLIGEFHDGDILNTNIKIQGIQARISRTGNSPKEQQFTGLGGSVGLGLLFGGKIVYWLNGDLNYDSYLTGTQTKPVSDGIIMRPFEMIYPSVTFGMRICI